MIFFKIFLFKNLRISAPPYQGRTRTKPEKLNRISINSVILLILLIPFVSTAKIHLEPYLGYSGTLIRKERFSFATFKQKNLLDKTQTLIGEVGTNSYYHGITPGMRLGYSSLNLAVGIDLSFGYWFSLYKEEIENFSGEQYVIPFLPGLFVSYKLPLLFRAYATFIPIGIVSIQTQDVNKSCTQSRAFKLGLSYFSLPFLSVNLEYLPMYINGEGCKSWSHTATIYGNITF